MSCGRVPADAPWRARRAVLGRATAFEPLAASGCAPCRARATVRLARRVPSASSPSRGRRGCTGSGPSPRRWRSPRRRSGTGTRTRRSRAAPSPPSAAVRAACPRRASSRSSIASAGSCQGNVVLDRRRRGRRRRRRCRCAGDRRQRPIATSAVAAARRLSSPAKKPFSHARWAGVNGAVSGRTGTIHRRVVVSLSHGCAWCQTHLEAAPRAATSVGMPADELVERLVGDSRASRR